MDAQRSWSPRGLLLRARAHLDAVRDGARRELDEKVRTDTHPRLTTVTAVARRVLAAPAPDVWALLPEVPLDAAVPTFVVPGTPVGAVGEVRCVLRWRRDGALVGTLHELLAVVPGHTRVQRERQELQTLVTTTTVDPLPDGSCRVAVWFAFQTARRGADAARTRMEVVPRRQLALLADRLAGAPAVPAVLEPHDESDLDGHELMVSTTVPATPEAVWAVVRPAEAARLDVADPDAVTFTVPGTPAGEIGEQICVVATWRPPVREAAVLEVIAQDPGRSFAVRSLSAPHLLAQAVVLEAVPGGTEVTVVVSLQEHAPVLAREAARRWDAAEAYLARMRDAVGSSAAGGA
ncbi:hypothetical protein [Cellulomonas cellasea]|uniref:Uncharacterized protein n=1 Tax=Cellulomonas cellasea TaxID=43670 RepID=A0A7W4UFN1_9CELL|nr:hypothetical protein [Cellulomonas cellasea]MBB2923252.1 hypothetical protein [Cellulomonas cellasea]